MKCEIYAFIFAAKTYTFNIKGMGWISTTKKGKINNR